MKITNRVVKNYLNCRYKAFLALNGENGTPHDYEVLMNELAEEYRPKATEALLRRCKFDSAARISSVTLDDLQQGHSLILDCTIETDQFKFHFDALKRTDNKSSLGSFHYQPVMFHHEDNVREAARMLLVCGAFILGQGQEHMPELGTLVVGQASRMTTIQLGKRSQKIVKPLDELRQLRDGTVDPKVRLNRHCDVCEFRQRCGAEAAEKDDLSLLRGMSDAEAEKLNGKGLFSTTQLSYTFRPRKPSKRARKTSGRRNFALHSLALREKTTYVLNRPSLPKTNTSVFVDIEGDPDRDLYYLLGALIRDGTEVTFHNYWADEPRDAPTLFRNFVATIEGHDDLTIFHYGAYENRYFSHVLRQQRCSKRIALAIDESVNVLRDLRNGVYFPTFSNSLKDVARHLGFQWTDKDASGAMSLVWRRRWEMTHNPIIKQKLLKYNQEDCLALALVTDALHAIQAGHSSVPTVRGSNEVAPVPDLVSDEGRHQFGTPDFFSATFEEVNRCAYFDYQRERILLRTRNKRISARPRTTKRKKYRPRPNKSEQVRSTKCPKCKSTLLARNSSSLHTRYNLNLRVSSSGMRRWITKYTAARHRCRDCGTTYVPPSLKAKEKFGHTLKAWTMYQHLANRISYQSLQTMCRECFGLHVNYTDLFAFKGELARFYQPTYKRLLQTLTTGAMLNVDETHINLRKERAYAWVLADFDNVAFLFRPNREGAFLVKMLEDFTGVLVSDIHRLPESATRCRRTATTAGPRPNPTAFSSSIPRTPGGW